MPRKKITPKEFSEVATGVRLSSHEKLCAERMENILKSIEEMRKIQSEHHYESVHFEGKAGSLFLGDFRGLHSGSILVEGKRVMLNYTWGLV